MKLDRLFLRSVRGQLTLLGVTYLGAILLAVVAIAARSIFFEHFLQERFDVPSEQVQALAKDLATGQAGADQLAQQTAEDRRLLYGMWLSDPQLDPQLRMARSLLAFDGPSMLERIRKTLVTGSAAFRARGIEMLGLVTEEALKPEARRLLDYAKTRAAQRGETELVNKADAALVRLGA